MIMVVSALDPVLLLTMVDNISYNGALVTTSATPTCIWKVHNATNKLIFWFYVACDGPVVRFKLPNVIVPMNRGGNSISDVQTK